MAKISLSSLSYILLKGPIAILLGPRVSYSLGKKFIHFFHPQDPALVRVASLL